MTSEKSITRPTAISCRSPFTELLLLPQQPRCSGAGLPAKKTRLHSASLLPAWRGCLGNYRIIETLDWTWSGAVEWNAVLHQHRSAKSEGSQTGENKISPPFLLNRNNSEKNSQDRQWLIHCRNCSRELHLTVWENTTPLILLRTAASWFILILEAQVLFFASTWTMASHNLLSFLLIHLFGQLAGCVSDAADSIWHSQFGALYGNSRATPALQKSRKGPSFVVCPQKNSWGSEVWEGKKKRERKHVKAKSLIGVVINLNK